MENGHSKRGLQETHQDEIMAKRTRQKKNRREDDNDNTTDEIHTVAEDSGKLDPPNVEIPKNFFRMRLEAIFYPKFENEQKENQRIRKQMKERVLNGEGYLEASIKHSGSLILWSGGERFYSKNSTTNVFTACAEMLLRQHFVRAYWNDNDGEHIFRECSKYVERKRITLAFEVVTSFLGDHGDRPNKDFLILTAVAVKSASPYFMPTFELVEFAQRFRLPHNDAWIFSTPTAVESLFSIYDNSRETGLASTINPALSNAADVHVSSLYPHDVFQGDIMEGIVIRYVPSPGDLAATLDRVKELSRISIEILENIVPPSLDACPDLVAQKADKTFQSPALQSDLRKLYNETEPSDKTAFNSQVTKLLEKSESKRKTFKVDRFESSEITGIAESLKGSSDIETKRIAGAILLLASLKDRVQYVLFQEKTPERNRWLCIVHVLFDRTFPKYRKQKEDPLDMELFRGFCIELIEQTNEDDARLEDPVVPPSSIQREEEPLMLKMKLLPYMIRTFCCRNGLATVKSGGASGFSKYCQNLLSKWGISRQGRETWQPFLSAWGEYASAVLTGRPVIPADKVATYEEVQPQGALDSRNFLEHIFYFTKLYHAGLYSELAQQWDELGSFRGLFIVVGPDATLASTVADFVAHQLHGAERLDDMTQLDKAFMERSVMRGGGHVLGVSLLGNDGGTKKVRDLLKEFRDVIVVVLFDLVGNKAIMKDPKTQGILKSWQKTDCGKVFTLPAESLVREDGSLEADEKFQSMVKECTFDNAYDRPGIVVFFPQIPGCGKSCLTSDEDHIRAVMQGSDIGERSRKVLVIAGDQTKDKYWPKVKHIRLRDTSSVVLADKNAPTAAWSSIGQVCEFTQAVAVAVLPEDAVETTEIVGIRSFHGKEEPDKTHVYPYSLTYLAVCMARVLERPQGTHAGKLDRGTKRACIVVLQFYSMYRNLTAERFRDEMLSRFQREGAALSSSPIQIPFFRSDALVQGIPSDLQEVLVDGLQALFGNEVEKKSIQEEDKQDAKRIENEGLDELEGRLRAVILRHRDYLLALTIDEGTAKEKFISQLKEKVAACNEMLAYDATVPRFIKLASLDVNRECLITMFKSLQEEPGLDDFFASILGSRNIEDVFGGGDRKLVANPHVTLAHFSELSQADLHKKFDHLQGLRVSLSVVALYWNADNVALEVEVQETTTCGTEFPSARNVFTHITVWVHDRSSAFKSNRLPMLVESGQASKFDFPRPLSLEGSVSLWDN